jgi:hypothetical protein
MKDKNEKKLTKENENDKFKCQACPDIWTRKKILSIWTSIPFGNEEKKTFYCGCMGWD